MRIAYHNPWTQSSENQVFMSMAVAARRVGLELVACADENDIEACRPDFVLSVATALAKITDFPTYLTVHEPTAYLLEQPQRVRNLFSYDGYLTISDSLQRFIKDFCFGVGRDEEPGFFFLTPQVSERRADWSRSDRADTLKVVYFGTNWNRRMPLLFRALDPMGVLRIHGPEESWRAEGYASYCGPVAFDGVGPQRIYAECGIGLALMDERWQREDVISNRIFEISSVGAVSICPDMPWTRKWFGDSALYFDAERPLREIAQQVKAHHAFCQTNPDAARQMGEQARRIFETHFAAERMLANAVAYHERKIVERTRRRAAMAPAPEISVVLRCGGRTVDVVKRAVDSIRSQTFGRFAVILAKYRDIDLAAITVDLSGAISRFKELLIPDGGRAEMLFAGIELVESPYFAVLDDDDFWMSDHFEELFRAGRRVREDFDMAFSGSIGFDFPVRYNETQSCSRNILRFGFEPAVADVLDVQNAIGTNCFVARSDLLREATRRAPDMRTAEDSLLICLLAWRSKPIFSYRPTAFYRRDAADGSNWQTDPERTADELTLALRVGLAWSPCWLASGSFAATQRIWADVRTRLGSTHSGEQIDRLLLGPCGRRTRDGIAAPSGPPGTVCFGPYVNLPPGSYQASFLIVPDEKAPGPVERGTIGEVDVCAEQGARVLARRELEPADDEVTLSFAVDLATAAPAVEFRVHSLGVVAFTVASVALHRLRAEQAEIATCAQPARAAGLPARAGVSGASAPATGLRASAEAVKPSRLTIQMLQQELAAMKASTSWRITAPLRWLGDRVRGGRG